jgi:hypothetical protein
MRDAASSGVRPGVNPLQDMVLVMNPGRTGRRICFFVGRKEKERKRKEYVSVCPDRPEPCISPFCICPLTSGRTYCVVRPWCVPPARPCLGKMSMVIKHVFRSGNDCEIHIPDTFTIGSLTLNRTRWEYFHRAWRIFMSLTKRFCRRR